jgi:Skp family chaperone for outer membrane proteins
MLRTVRYFSAAAIVAALSATSGFAQSVDVARIGALRLSYVAANSKAGKAAIAQIEEIGRRKSVEVESKAVDLQRQEAELQKQSPVMSPRAVADLQRAFEKSRVAFDRFQQDAQAEVAAMQQQIDAEFQLKLRPIVDEISREKGLHFVFGIEQASMVSWWSPAVDISDEVVKRLDAKP